MILFSLSSFCDEFVINEAFPRKVDDFDDLPVNPQSVMLEGSDFALLGFLAAAAAAPPRGVKSLYDLFKLSRRPSPPENAAPKEPLLHEWTEPASRSIWALRLSMPLINCTAVARNVFAVARSISTASNVVDWSAVFPLLDEAKLQSLSGCWGWAALMTGTGDKVW